MKDTLRKLVAGLSALAMLPTVGVYSVLAEETSNTTMSATEETIYNDFDKPLLADGIHGDTNLEDMEYVHYEWEEVQTLLDGMVEISNAEYSTDNLLLFDDLDTQLNELFVKVSSSSMLIYLYYNQEPTAENLEEYTYTSELYTKFYTEYFNTLQSVMESDFGSSLLEDLADLLNYDDLTDEESDYYLSIYFYYYSFLLMDVDDSTFEIQTEINSKQNQYMALIQTDISNVQVEFDGRTMSYAELERLYTIEYLNIKYSYIDIADVPADVLEEYYSIEDTLDDVKAQYGIDNDTLGQLYIDIVKLYNEYAQLVGYDDYIDLSYDYDADSIEKISSDIKEYVTPILTKYYEVMSDNTVFTNTANKTYSLDTAKDISSTVISAVGSEYAEVYDYMDGHNLISLDDDYLYAQGYTTAVTEYSQAYIYLTFDSNQFYDWFTNGVAHEFGHFIDWYNNVDDYATYGMATAENVSVSFSYLCNDNLNAYFDDTTSNVLTVSNTVDNTLNYVNSCFATNEFELYAFENADTITVEQLDQKFLEVYLDYGIIDDIDYQIGKCKEVSWFNAYSQLYTTPFYMVDYGMAGLTALNVLSAYVDDHDDGLALFDLLYDNDYYGYDYISMMVNGLGINPYSDDYVLNTANFLEEYLSSKMSLIPDIEVAVTGDINLDGVVDGLDILTLKRYLLGMDVTKYSIDISKADMDGDGSVNLVDLLYLKKQILSV